MRAGWNLRRIACKSWHWQEMPHMGQFWKLLLDVSNDSSGFSNFHRNWVQAIGLFAQATCAPEFGLPRPFNQRLIVLHVGGAAVRQQVMFKTNKFQNKNKNKNKKRVKKKGHLIDCVFKTFMWPHFIILESLSF